MNISESKVIRNLLIAFLALMLVFIVGTVGYRILGGPQYSWMDCFYMTFITISTIGYHEVVDVTRYEYGRLFTVFIGIAGIGVMGYVLSTLTAFMLENDLNISRRRKKMKTKIEQLKSHYIVCGVGLVGSNVAHDLELTGRPSVIVDNDIENIQRYLENIRRSCICTVTRPTTMCCWRPGVRMPKAYLRWHMTTAPIWSSA